MKENVAKSQNLIKSRPAETTALAAAVAVLVAYFLGIDDPGIMAALTIVVGAIPGVVTWIVEMTKKP
jgi:hypothetical protein